MVKLNEKGEPIYTDKDVVDLEKMKQFGLPFWLAGGYGTPQQVQKRAGRGRGRCAGGHGLCAV